MTSHLRSKSIGTKVTPEEYATLEALAGPHKLSEWVRTVLLQTAAPHVESLVLAELLALRTIVLNLHFSLCRGEAVTTEAMQRLIEWADQGKVRQAQERLAIIERKSS